MSYKETCYLQAHTLTRHVHHEEFQVLAPYQPHCQAHSSKCRSQHTCTGGAAHRAVCGCDCQAVCIHACTAIHPRAARTNRNCAHMRHVVLRPEPAPKHTDNSRKIQCARAKRLGCKLVNGCLGALCVSAPNGSVTSARGIAVDVWKAAHTLHCISVVASWWVWLALEGLQRKCPHSRPAVALFCRLVEYDSARTRGKY